MTHNATTTDGPAPARVVHGRTTIAPRVVEKVARAAAREPNAEWQQAVRGVRAHGAVDHTGITLRLEVTVTYPGPIGQIAAVLRQHVSARVQELTGLTVLWLGVIIVPVAAERGRVA